MSGRIIPTILGKQRRFPGIEPGNFMIGLRTVMALVGISFS